MIGIAVQHFPETRSITLLYSQKLYKHTETPTRILQAHCIATLMLYHSATAVPHLCELKIEDNVLGLNFQYFAMSPAYSEWHLGNLVASHAEVARSIPG